MGTDDDPIPLRGRTRTSLQDKTKGPTTTMKAIEAKQKAEETRKKEALANKEAKDKKT